MAPLAIAIYSGRADLHDTLRRRCPGFTFETEGAGREGCRVAVVDDDSNDATAPKAIARIVLAPGRGAQRAPSMSVPRDVFLENPANYLAFAVDLAEAAIHASQLEVEVGYLTQIAELMSMTDASAVSERITRTVLNLLGLARGTLFIHDPRLERYVVSFTNDADVRDTGEFLPGVPQSLLQRALSSGQSFASDEAMIVIPLQVEDDLVGVIKVPLAAGERIDADAAANVSRYIGAVASVLGNIYQLTRSQDLAMRDDLTKAFNRRFFESYLDEEIERSRRYGSLFSIIFLDLDELKTVNDFYGHLTGSRTLQEVAKRILGAVRGIDKVVRFGGDEFCIILPQTDQEQAVAVANRVRKSIIGAPFRLDPDIEVSITASFGIATYPTHGIAKDDLVRQADLAMYRVKSTTKNAVGVATVEPVTRPATI
ncbi:MAG TPA: GGDEF domain-containing protein [Thermoanaerobaculia bacterium]